MKGLSEKFASLQQEEGLSNVEIALILFKDIFFPATPEPTTSIISTTLKVFAAGLPRSGTGSLAVALAELGYNPCHGPGAMELEPIFAEHYDGRATNLDILRWQEEHGYDAQGLDQLGWKLYEEAATIPGVKIILTEHPRGGVAWAESWSSFVPDHIYYFSHMPFSFIGSLRQVMALQREFLSYIGGTDNPRDPAFTFPAIDLALAYEKHNEAVKTTVPADRLLVFNPTQGWDPLCKFLNIEDCPRNTPFPHMTDRQMMMVMSKVALVLTWVWPLLPLPFFVLIVYFYRKKRRKQKVA